MEEEEVEKASSWKRIHFQMKLSCVSIYYKTFYVYAGFHV